MTPSGYRESALERRADIWLRTVPANHLYNETTVCFVRLVLNIAFATFHRGVFIPHITETTFEDGQKGLPIINASNELMVEVALFTLLYN